MARKRYTIEVPLYTNSLARLVEINGAGLIDVLLYGGFPDSPLNGGRSNFALDGLPPGGRAHDRFSEELVERAHQRFYETVRDANLHGIAFLLAYTNMFVDLNELSERNLAVIRWLCVKGQEHGLRNGVILNNRLLEDHLRREFSSDLMYVSSCTRYVSPHRILGPDETVPMYLEDVRCYDSVVVTPQDSRRPEVLTSLCGKHPAKIIAICNSYCAFTCNSYDHYEMISRDNKKPLEGYRLSDAVGMGLRIASRSSSCPVITGEVRNLDVSALATMQLACGVQNFKLGRGIGAERVESVIDLIEDHEKRVSLGN